MLVFVVQVSLSRYPPGCKAPRIFAVDGGQGIQRACGMYRTYSTIPKGKHGTKAGPNSKLGTSNRPDGTNKPRTPLQNCTQVACRKCTPQASLPISTHSIRTELNPNAVKVEYVVIGRNLAWLRLFNQDFSGHWVARKSHF